MLLPGVLLLVLSWQPLAWIHTHTHITSDIHSHSLDNPNSHWWGWNDGNKIKWSWTLETKSISLHQNGKNCWLYTNCWFCWISQTVRTESTQSEQHTLSANKKKTACTVQCLQSVQHKWFSTASQCHMIEALGEKVPCEVQEPSIWHIHQTAGLRHIYQTAVFCSDHCALLFQLQLSNFCSVTQLHLRRNDKDRPNGKL